MQGFAVVAGEGRIDLNLHLAPPDFLPLGSGSSPREHPLQQQPHHRPEHQGRGPVQGGQEIGRRILPRFGPGIHGVFLDLHQEPGTEPDQAFLSPPLAHQHPFRRYAGLRLGGPPTMRYHPPVHHPEFHHPELLCSHHQQVLENRRSDASSLPVAEPAKDVESDANVKPVADNFECNVCLELAEEPVVTLCGHLFCWKCLYQWLYVHSGAKECPVCKGSVTESSIIPIYGRGNTPSAQPSPPAAADSVGAAGGIPPRPRARRVESLRQSLDMEDRPEVFDYLELLRGSRSRAFRNLRGIIPNRLMRRRMSERREHYRTPVGPVPVPVAPAASRAVPPPPVPRTEDMGELIRSFRGEDPAASIRARLNQLMDAIHSHRRRTASFAVAAQQEPDPVAPPPAGGENSSGVSMREAGEASGSGASGSGASASGDAELRDSFPSRKRRRLN